MWDLWKEVKEQTGKEIVIQTPTQEIFNEMIKKARSYNKGFSSTMNDGYWDWHKGEMCLRITGRGGYAHTSFYKSNDDKFIVVML